MQSLIKSAIRTIPDYPKEGIQFRDITTLLENPTAFRMSIDSLVHRYLDQNIQTIVGIEARGFIFGAALAYALGIRFVPIRKVGKLPHTTLKQAYQLEYGEDSIEIHTDSLEANERIVLIDDLIATGGTAAAAIALIRQLEGNIIESCFIVDLPDLGGSQKLQNALNCPCFSVCEFAGE